MEIGKLFNYMRPYRLNIKLVFLRLKDNFTKINNKRKIIWETNNTNYLYIIIRKIGSCYE